MKGLALFGMTFICVVRDVAREWSGELETLDMNEEAGLSSCRLQPNLTPGDGSSCFVPRCKKSHKNPILP